MGQTLPSAAARRPTLPVEELAWTMETLDRIADEILEELTAQDTLREEALTLSRQVIRLAGRTIRAIHRHEFSPALEQLAEAGKAIARLNEIAVSCPLFASTGYVSDAEKEFAEAHLTYALIREEPLPYPQELGIGVAPFLNGMGEAVGELRRSILDALREDNLEPCESRLEMMQQICDFLATVDYPDALTGGLRRTTDVARRIVEITRADWTTALRQHRLQQALEELEERLSAPS